MYWSDIILVFIGLPIGVAASALAWWIITHRFNPIIKFSIGISKTKTSKNNPKYMYRIKFENAGRRTILDLELITKLRIKGLKPSLKNNWQVIYIPVTNNNIPKITPVRKSKSRTIITLLLNEVKDFSKSIYPEWIRNKYLEKSILLEDLFELGTKLTLQVYGFGYDEFSGNKKLFESKIYSELDIEEGYFDKNGLQILKRVKSKLNKA